MVKDAVHPNGFLGYVQGTGKEPKDGQPVTYKECARTLKTTGVRLFPACRNRSL